MKPILLLLAYFGLLDKTAILAFVLSYRKIDPIPAKLQAFYANWIIDTEQDLLTFVLLPAVLVLVLRSKRVQAVVQSFLKLPKVVFIGSARRIWIRIS